AGAVVAAVGQVQQRLVRLWCEVLELDQVGATDNFFDLGGDSRTLAILAARVSREFDTHLRVVDLMDAPTIKGLATRLADGDGSAARKLGDLAARRAALRSRRR
ncbi:MAG: phosphopantetheine-binding protein, partial [Pseudonocardiaceae bacterium]